jgi:hypothetical protein
MSIALFTVAIAKGEYWLRIAVAIVVCGCCYRDFQEPPLKTDRLTCIHDRKNHQPTYWWNAQAIGNTFLIAMRWLFYFCRCVIVHTSSRKCVGTSVTSAFQSWAAKKLGHLLIVLATIFASAMVFLQEQLLQVVFTAKAVFKKRRSSVMNSSRPKHAIVPFESLLNGELACIWLSATLK